MELFSSDIELASGVSDSSVIAELESIIDSSLGFVLISQTWMHPSATA